MKISSEVQIPPSATIAMNSLAAAKKKQGETVYNMTVGEPMIDTPQVIKDAALRAMNEGKTLYPPAAGIPELREAVADWINKNFGSNFEKNNVIATCGGKHALLMILQSLLEAGDEVLIVAPYWVSYPSMVTLCHGVSKFVETKEENAWKVKPEDIANICSEKTKILILNNGSNPTGVLYTREEIQKILAVAAERNLIVISDEVYSGLVYDAGAYISAASFPEYTDRVVIVQSASKHFAMTGWRVGFVLGPKNLIDTLETLQSQSTTGTSSISQWAALAAIQNADTLVPEINTEMQKRRDAFLSSFQKYFGKNLMAPPSGLYVFLSLKDLGVEDTDSLAWCMKVLQEANVVFVPGSPFGAEGYIRASFGGKIPDIDAALKQLSEYLKK